ncbi:MAG: hypothetical protein ACRD16_16725 [Thermoanaerobaculia bacterium]
MRVDTFVVVYLHSPRERWWGLLHGLGPAGVTLRGVSLDSFEPWARSVARREEGEISPSTVFFPMNRVERIYEDESTLAVPSHEDQFRQWTGEEPRLYLGAAPQGEH